MHLWRNATGDLIPDIACRDSISCTCKPKTAMRRRQTTYRSCQTAQGASLARGVFRRHVSVPITSLLCGIPKLLPRGKSLFALISPANVGVSFAKARFAGKAPCNRLRGRYVLRAAVLRRDKLRHAAFLYEDLCNLLLQFLGTCSKCTFSRITLCANSIAIISNSPSDNRNRRF